VTPKVVAVEVISNSLVAQGVANAASTVHAAAIEVLRVAAAG